MVVNDATNVQNAENQSPSQHKYLLRFRSVQVTSKLANLYELGNLDVQVSPIFADRFQRKKPFQRARVCFVSRQVFVDFFFFEKDSKKI